MHGSTVPSTNGDVVATGEVIQYALHLSADRNRTLRIPDFATFLI